MDETIPSELRELLHKFDQKRTSIAFDDEVLLSGVDSDNGSYVVLAEVEKVEDEDVYLLKKKKYYFNGRIIPLDNEHAEHSIDYVKKSIIEKFEEDREFAEWLNDELSD